MNLMCPLCGTPEPAHLYTKKAFTVFRCPSCTLAFTWPQLSEQAGRRLYGNTYFESWGIDGDPSVREMKKRTFDLRLKAIEKHIPPGRILDVGCATGFFLEAASDRGWSAYGVDVNPHAVELARKQFGDRVIEGTIDDARLGGEMFDAITMSDALEHVHDPFRTLFRANELLRNGGIVAVVTPNVRGISSILLGRRWPHLKAEHQFYFSPRTLSYVLQKAGFRVLSVRPALKALSLNYIYAQRTVTRVPLLTPLVSAVRRVLPASVGRKPLYFLAGEMFALAQKEGSPRLSNNSSML
ncbi:class I SAM-dependent methyltransferase [Candidatus Poribacteria bacterium]|nr:class I SAM-dependent methyltransferase [Candidatus Poribacteria bacterium]